MDGVSYISILLLLVLLLLFSRYMRMSPERFDYLLSLVSPLISKHTTKLREPISAAERLALTLRFLASGNSQQSMLFSYRVGRQTVSSVIKETCHAIWQVLNEKYLRAPNLPDDWENIAEEFIQLEFSSLHQCHQW